MPAAHRFQEHTGEVRLEVTAPSLGELFAEAGRGLAELMLGALPRREPTGGREVQVRARDRAALLVGWLNELIFLSEISKEVFTHFEVQEADELHLRAVIAGLRPETIKTAVKAATLHQVEVERAGSGWRATVVLDV